MAVDKKQSHRPGAFKQTNKGHKHGRHRSKNSISNDTKGKVSVKLITKKAKVELNREQRRHQALQIRQNKRDELLTKKRSLGGMDFSPFLVCVVPLHSQMDPAGAISLLTQCDSEAVVNKSATGVTHICISRFKQRFSLVVPPSDNELAILDTLKICDTVLFLVSAVAGREFGAETVDDFGISILQASFGQGLPTPIVAITDLESVSPKKRNEHKQNIQKLVNKWLPDEKLVPLDKSTDAINTLRRIGSQKRKNVLYRDRRPHLYAENVKYVADSQGTEGTLKITGYLRGAPLSVNGLIHIPGLGDFQMSQIESPADPFAVTKEWNNDASMVSGDSTVTIKVLAKCDPAKQEPLQSENVPDPMDAEQTWPTEEEIKMAENDQKIKKVKKIPKGWSDYQAAWIPDEDTELLSQDSNDEDDEERSYLDAMSEEKSECSDAEEEFDAMTESEVAVNDQQYDNQMDFHAERTDLEKLKAAKSDRMFPDEIDTPHDTTARVRFQKYRGLESFRTSPWDPKENLPGDYARIFQFQNFDRTRKRVLKEVQDLEGAQPGWYVTIHVKQVSQLLWSTFQNTKAPVVLMGLFPHEHKMSVLNVVLKRTSNYDEPIKSKERLVFQCGYRRFIVNPIFSQHTNGSKHKFERFLQPEATAVATFYAPIQFSPAPVLCYKEINNRLVLVATGSLLSCNPDRLVVKRIVLSGHPLKVHKRSAVIRFMFFNREDIAFFKPCKLRTKHGRTGHIKEPLGTHGHMKVVFDGQLKSQDTVMLNLFKRVFPKWTYDQCIVSCESSGDKMEC